MTRIELIAMIAFGVLLGIVGTVGTFGIWTLIPWAIVILGATLFIDVRK